MRAPSRRTGTANSTPPELSARICSDGVGLARIDGMRRAERARLLELGLGKIDGDDLARAGRPRSDQRGQADTAQSNDSDGRAHSHLRGVDNGARRGERRRTKQFASSSGTWGLIFTTERGDTVAYSANTEQPR